MGTKAAPLLAALFSGFPFPLYSLSLSLHCFSLVGASYLSRRPFYSLRTRPLPQPLPLRPSFALTCLECSRKIFRSWRSPCTYVQHVVPRHPPAEEVPCRKDTISCSSLSLFLYLWPISRPIAIALYTITSLQSLP